MPNNYNANTGARGEMKSLDWVAYIFIAYSGAHNTINAWHRAEGFLFFIFVLVGILSVEIVLHAVYKHWKDGRLAGKMLRAGKYSAALAMFFATAGILAQAQGGGEGEVLSFYYSFILPASAPVMFLCAWWIQAVDPVMRAERDQVVYDAMYKVELKREKLDQKMDALTDSKGLRLLRRGLKNQRLMELQKESMSRRTRSTLRRSVKLDMPVLFKQIGIKDAAINPPARSLFSLRRPALEEASSDGHASKEPPSFTSARVNTLVSPKVAAEKGESKKRSTKGPKRKICKYDRCDNELTGRQTKFCSAACSQADYRERQKQTA